MKLRHAPVGLILQAAAVVLPVAVLTGVALHFLRADKAEIERQAREQARAQLPELTRAFGDILRNSLERKGELRDGQALAVPDYPPQPEPDPSLVSPAAMAKLHSLEETRQVALAVETAHQYPQALTPSGTPVAALALLIGLRSVHQGPLPDALLNEIRRNVTEFPSFLSPELLATPQLRREWDTREQARQMTREMVRAVAGRLADATGPTTFRTSDARIAVCTPSPRGWLISFYPESPVRRTTPLPSYAGLTVRLDSEAWRAGVSDAAPLLAAETTPLDGAHRLIVSIYLRDSQLLYRQYDTRLKWMQWLICCTSATALIGLASLWVGYRRQGRLSEMKSNFVSSVSHELRAPLAAVRLMAESLDTGRVSEESRRQDYYRLIVEECRRLTGLVENVLDLARIGSGRKSYRFEPVDVTALLRHSVALMEPCAAEQQVHLRLEPPAAEGQAAWDAQAVEQSLVNLLDNAIQHSPPGSEVKIAAEQTGENWRLWVEDQGPGIPPGEQRRIFELFYRHGSELRRETRGVGIGLSIVRHVAEAHGGRVIVDSEVGRGSRFILELPLEHRS